MAYFSEEIYTWAESFRRQNRARQIFMNPSERPGARSPAVDTTPTLSSTQPLEENGQRYQEFISLGTLETRHSTFKSLAANVKQCSLSSHRSFWPLLEELVDRNASIELRESAFAYLKAIAASPDLTSDDFLKLLTLIKEPVAASHVFQQVAALEALLAHRKHPEILRDGFNEYILSVLKRQYDFVADKRRELKVQRTESLLPESCGLDALMAFFLHLVSAGPEFVSDRMVPDMVEELFALAGYATLEKDLKAVLKILQVLTQLDKIPVAQLKKIIGLFCSVLYLNDDLQGIAESCLAQLCRSRTGESVVETLLEIVKEAPAEKKINRARGALLRLIRLYRQNGAQGSPRVSFEALINLVKTTCFLNEKYQRDSLLFFQQLFCEEALQRLVLGENWKKLFEVLIEVLTKPPPALTADIAKGTHHAASSIPLKSPLANTKLDEWNEYCDSKSEAIADSLEILYSKVTTDQQKQICVFYLATKFPLPDMALQHLVDEFLSLDSSPATLNRPKTLKSLVTNVIYDAAKRTSILEQLTEKMAKTVPQARMRDLVFSLLSQLPQEHNVELINAIAVLATTFAQGTGFVDVANIVSTLIKFVDIEDTSQAASDSLLVEPPNNTITISLVRLFQHHMSCSAETAVLLYDALVDLAKDMKHSPSARLSAMRLLTRLRCTKASSTLSNSNTETHTSLTTASASFNLTSVASSSLSNAIMVVDVPDSLGLAAHLCRTEGSVSVMTAKLDVAGLESAIEQPRTRTGRASNISSPSASRSETRSTSGQNRGFRATRPLWMYPGRKGLPTDPPKTPSGILRLGTSGSNSKTTVRIHEWLETMIEILKEPDDWEIYSYILVHLPSQLSNPLLFADCLARLRDLKDVIVTQLRGGTIHEPPPKSGVKRDNVVLCLIYSLKMLMAYRNLFTTGEQEETVKIFLSLQGQFDRVAKTCIQALTLLSYEHPRAVARCLDDILQKMAQMITKAHLAIDILEFLRCLASLPHLHADLSETQTRMVFVICITHLEQSREQRDKLHRSSTPSVPNQKQNRQSTISLGSDSSQNIEVHKELPQYIYALAYHVMADWFLALKLVDRPKYVGWITSRLSSTDAKGHNVMEPQSQVMLDMMLRTAYSDLGETKASTLSNPKHGVKLKKSWIVGLSIVTIETAALTGYTQVTTRQASGTTHALYIQHTAPLPAHHILMNPDAENAAIVYPSHVFLQQHSTVAPTPVPMEPICLPDDGRVQRAISAFDLNDTVDGYKAGVIYIGNGQCTEVEILANRTHSSGFDALLEGLGTKVPLQGAQFNTQGLNRNTGADGEYTYAWRNRVVEIVYHVPTMMPTNLDHDPQCVEKKRHIGNDHVNIIYNESGLPFDFNTFASQFNYVNIVITPDGSFAPEAEPDAKLETIHEGSPSSTSLSPNNQGHVRHVSSAVIRSPPEQATSRPSTQRTYRNPLYETIPVTSPALEETFKVQTLLHPSFPPLTPTHTTQTITATALAPLVRHMALNASVFSKAWAAREYGETPSSWCKRLEEIYTLRERYNQSGNVSAAGVTESEAGKATGESRKSGVFSGLGFFKKGKEREETQFTGIKAEKKYVEGDKWIGEVRMGGLTEEEGVKSGLDFSRWGGENPKLEEATNREE